MITGGKASEPRDKPGALGLLFLLALAAIPIVDQATSLREDFFLGSLVAVQAYGLQIAWRYCGVFSMAYTALSGVGAYSTVILAAHYGLPFWVGELVGIGGALLLGLIVGAVSLRSTGMAFVMLTYALVAALEVVVDNGGSTSGGTSGLSMVQPMDLGVFSVGLTSELGAYFLMYVVLVASVIAVVLPRFTRAGKRMIAARDNEQLARSVGMQVRAMRILVLCLSGILPALAGGVYAFHEFHIEPSVFNASAALSVLVALVIGGMYRWSGPIVGAAVTTILPQYLGFSPIVTQIAYGIVLVLVIIALPEGLSGAFSRLGLLIPPKWRWPRRATGVAPTPQGVAGYGGLEPAATAPAPSPVGEVPRVERGTHGA